MDINYELHRTLDMIDEALEKYSSRQEYAILLVAKANILIALQNNE
jgi:hypothetical protein